MTGEYKEQIEQFQSQLSGQQEKISQIEKSLGTGGVVMQIKSELGNEYRDVISMANGGLSSQITWTNGLISVVSILVPLVVAGIGIYFKKIIEQKVKNISVLQNKTKELHSIIKKQAEITENQIEQMKTIQGEIESQDSRIYNHVMEVMTNYWFDRLSENLEDWDNLRPNILILDENIVRKREKNYDILLKCVDAGNTSYAVIYQFFPDKLFGRGMINERIKSTRDSNFPSEIIKSTNLIFNYYNQNKNNNLQIEIEKYLQGLLEKIINNQLYQEMYGSIEQEKIKTFIDNNITNIGEQEMRENIKNPPKVEIIEGNTVEQK